MPKTKWVVLRWPDPAMVHANAREPLSHRIQIVPARIGTNRNTLKENLTKMVRRGLLVRSGLKRGTTYRLGPAVEGGALNREVDH